VSNVQLIGVLGLVAIAACWILATILYRVGATSRSARMLTLVLVVEGLTLATAGFPDFALGVGPDFYEAHPGVYQFLFMVHTTGDAAMLALYPPFLAAALNSRLTRPFASSPARRGLIVTAMALVVAVFVSPLEIGATLLYLMLSLLFGYALVASVAAWRAAPTGIARDRARIFVFAFGFRDVCWGFAYAASIWMVWTGTYLSFEGTTFDWIVKVVYALGTLLAVPLVAYGILRTQLFDIDLRIRWTIKQSTLAAVIIALVYLISEAADRLLSAELGNIAGLLAAAVVVFFLTPLQRFAERVASAAMPNTENTPEYAAHRKMQVYEAALEEALQDGRCSDKERMLLDRLRDSLGISPADATALERDIAGSVSVR